MSVELDQVLRIGPIVVGALVESTVRHGSWPDLSIHATKHPVAILIRRDDATTAFGIDGIRIPPDDLERRFPGQRAAFERAAAGDRGP